MLAVGVVANRRIALLAGAVAARGGRFAAIDWKELLTDAGLDRLAGAAAAHRWCKFDSPGEDATLTDALIRRGWRLDGERGPPPEPLRHGELAYGHWWFLGFADLMRRAGERLAGVASLRLVNPAADILDMTDKWICQQRLGAAGVAVPEPFGTIEGFDAFDARHPPDAAPRVFVKARYGSSAAGVIALQRHRDGRLVATTSARIGDDGRVYNHLRVARHTDRATIARLVDRLAAQGAYAERWVAKPRAPVGTGLSHDLRVVAFGGRPRQRIARMSATPLTNLHLGNRRAAPDWHGDAENAALDGASAAAASAFARSHSIGLDMIVRGREAIVIEANAFGDLLPGLVHEGRTTYDDQAWLAAADER